DEARIAELLDRYGEPFADGDLAVRLDPGVGLADVVRGLDAEGIELLDVELRAPTLDDVFLAKTGRKLEGGEPTEAPEAVPA
ncbi:MAG: hypothetical protein ACRDPU_10870, partial [Thermoleophilia bacterium]